MSPLRKPIAAYQAAEDSLKAWLRARGWGRALLESFKAYDRHGCNYMTGTLSFYAVVSLIPLVYFAFWTMTRIIGPTVDVQAVLETMLNQFLLPDSASAVMGRAERLFESDFLFQFGAWWGILAFLWSGMRFYEALHVVLTRAWGGGTSRPFLQRKAWTVLAFIVACMFFSMTMMITAAVTTLSRLQDRFPGFALADFEAAILWVLPWLISICMVYLLYKYMPTAYVPWRLAVGAAIPVGIIWELFKRVFTSIVVDSGVYNGIYGPMAGFVLLLVWIYISSVIVLFGAEYAAAWEKEYYVNGNGGNSGAKQVRN